MALVQNQTQRPKEQNRRPRHIHTAITPPYFVKGAKTCNGEKTFSSANIAEKTRHLHVED
jgi:hypothetical protein